MPQDPGPQGDAPGGASRHTPLPSVPLDDPRIVQILSTEHWSVLSFRSLVYNEAFTRAGMFLSFLSMSTVALGLLAQATAFGRDFMVIAAIVLGFDLVIGLTTYLRVAGANYDDLRALHGLSRIRHAYTEMAPSIERYFTSPVHDDTETLIGQYSDPWGMGEVVYGLSTTLGMLGLISSAVAGVLAAVIALLLGASGGIAASGGVVAVVIVFAGLVLMTFKAVDAAQRNLPAVFPAEVEGE